MEAASRRPLMTIDAHRLAKPFDPSLPNRLAGCKHVRLAAEQSLQTGVPERQKSGHDHLVAVQGYAATGVRARLEGPQT